MNSIFRHRQGLCGATLALALSVSASPVLAGAITGAISINPPTPTVNQAVVLKVGGQGDYCGVRINMGDGEPSTNVDFNGSNGYTKPIKGTEYSYTFKKTGTFQIKVIGSPSLSPKCTGEANLTVTVKPIQLKLPVMTPSSCVTGFENLTGDAAAGELRCRKNPVACPTHFEGSIDSATGKLECVPKPAECPAGWVGGMQGGKLVCNSAPLPKVPCAESTPTNQWGASYYTEGWRIYGCSKNLAPPK